MVFPQRPLAGVTCFSPQGGLEACCPTAHVRVLKVVRCLALWLNQDVLQQRRSYFLLKWCVGLEENGCNVKVIKIVQNCKLTFLEPIPRYSPPKNKYLSSRKKRKIIQTEETWILGKSKVGKKNGKKWKWDKSLLTQGKNLDLEGKKNSTRMFRFSRRPFLVIVTVDIGNFSKLCHGTQCGSNNWLWSWIKTLHC